ncbi:MAG TPA: hypothetical protein PKH54_02270 [Myxococcota bacterium]|nr:hypothetical protein [Myxococcota bacterium]
MSIGRFPGRFMFVAVALAALAVGGFSGCKGGGAGVSPELYVTATGAVDSSMERVNNGENRDFREGGGTMVLVFGNMGDDILQISNIEIVEKNEDMLISQDVTAFQYPIFVENGDYREVHETVVKLNITYVPDADRDLTPTRIRLTTNDPMYAGGIFEFTVSPNEKTAEIKVTPNNYIFMGATSMNPATASFTVENVGDADLALASIRVEPASAYSITYTSRPIHENMIIDPTVEGSAEGPIEVVVQYRPVTPPDLASLEIQWGSLIDTGVECSGTPTCQNSDKLCPDKSKSCPYTCFNGRCNCTFSDQCRAYFCDDPQSPDCKWRCLTGVCRVPELTSVPLRGEAQAGSLEITHGDQADGCVNFQSVTVPGTSCTKALSLANPGPGSVLVTKPTVQVSGSPETSPYTVQWFKLGAQKDGECGNVTGEEITENKYTLTPENSPITVAITYVAPADSGFNGEMKVLFANPYDGEQIVSLCGGDKKGELAIAPAPEKVRMTLYAAPGTTAKKSFVVMNKGNLGLEIAGVSVEPANLEDPQAFSILESATGPFTLSEGEVRRFTVSFNGTHDGGTTVNGFVNIDYVDPLAGEGGQVINQKINVAGFNSFDGVTLPVADAGQVSGPIKAGDSVVLDGTASVPGSYPIPANSGYIWFVSKKPPASRVFLNSAAAQGQLTVVPDVGGDYEFRLVVFSVEPDSGQAYFSHESTLSFSVMD